MVVFEIQTSEHILSLSFSPYNIFFISNLPYKNFLVAFDSELHPIFITALITLYMFLTELEIVDSNQPASCECRITEI